MADTTDEKVLKGDGLVELVKKIKGADSALSGRLDTVEESAHSHSNKTLLDTYTQTEASLADAVAKKHSHTEAQTSAMDSGITSAKVSSYDTHVADSDIHVTADQKAEWSGKQDKLSNTDAEIKSAVSNSHAHSNKALLDTYTQTNENLADAVSKKHAHTTAQTSAMNSGITSSKVSSYDTHVADSDIHVTAEQKSEWDAKQDKLTNTDTEIQSAVDKAHSHTLGQVGAMDSGITADKVASYDSHIADTVSHVTADDKSKWNGKQDKLTNTDEEIQSAVSNSHTHANKALLDTYTQTEANLADAVAKKHSHTDAQTSAMNSGITAAKVASYDTALTYIPTAASADNKLADKAYVDAIGSRLESRYLASSALGEPFATHAALLAATEYYYNGEATVPDTNDVTVVMADEDHKGVTSEASTTRYRWVGDSDTGSWAFEYIINNSALSQAQLLAVNSGITPTKVAGYDAHVADTNIHITADERTKWNTGAAAAATAVQKITGSVNGSALSLTGTEVDLGSLKGVQTAVTGTPTASTIYDATSLAVLTNVTQDTYGVITRTAVTLPVDTAVTADSNKLVTSGAVSTAIASIEYPFSPLSNDEIDAITGWSVSS